jgi:hypothetical protein
VYPFTILHMIINTHIHTPEENNDTLLFLGPCACCNQTLENLIRIGVSPGRKRLGTQGPTGGAILLGGSASCSLDGVTIIIRPCGDTCPFVLTRNVDRDR